MTDKLEGQGFEPDEALLRAAQTEMRRTLPSEERPAKKARVGGEERTEIGRFDYASTKDLEGGIQGFLITCAFRREKSATREVSSLLTLHSDAAAVTAADAEQAPGAEGTAGHSSSGFLLSLVKLDARGVVVFRLAGKAGQTAAALGRTAEHSAFGLLESVERGKVPPLQHAQRVMPLHTTCLLEAAALTAAGAYLAGLAAQELRDAAQPSFGVAYKGRASSDGTGAGQAVVMERHAAIAAVATGFESALKEQHGIQQLKVDLKAPAVVVSVEVLPVMGRLYAGLVVLPLRVCSVRNKLGIRAAGADGSRANAGAAAKEAKN